MAQCMNAFAMQAWTPEFERQNPRISLKALVSVTQSTHWKWQRPEILQSLKDQLTGFTQTKGSRTGT